MQSETKKTVSSLSGEYSKAAKAVVELTRRYNESVGKTGKASSETKNLKTMLAQAEAQLRATTTALKAANNGMDGFASSTDKASGKSLAGAIAQGTVMAGIFSKLGSAALSAAEGFISSGIEYNAQIEKYTTGFTNMLGSAEAAQQVMSQIAFPFPALRLMGIDFLKTFGLIRTGKRSKALPKRPALSAQM